MLYLKDFYPLSEILIFDHVQRVRRLIDLDVKFKECARARCETFWLLRAGQLYLINQLVEFNPDSKSLVNRQTGRTIQLQLPASLCFLYLITHASDIVSQNTLMIVGWGERNNVTTTNTFYQAILTLRNALAEVGLPRDTVKTISRRGLRLNENAQVEVIPDPQSEVSLPPVIEERAPVKVILTTPQQTTQTSWWNILFSVSIVIATLVIWLVWYQTRPVMPFSKFVSVSMQIPSRQNCKIYYSPNEYDQHGYFNLMQLHPLLCENNKHVFLSGYLKAERMVAFVCDKDARIDAHAFCTTHYYWMRGQ